MAAQNPSSIETRFRLRLSAGDTVAVGPGKIALLEAIHETRSINAAAKSLGMSYKRAWDLLNELSSLMVDPPVASVKGGSTGGGTTLTEAGTALVSLYRSIERRAALACQPELEQIKSMLNSPH